MLKFNPDGSPILPVMQHIAGTFPRIVGHPSYYGVYQQFALVFGVPKGNITDPNSCIVGGQLAGNLIFAEDGEANELMAALQKWLANPSTENLIEVADGAADLIYVVCQLCWALDIPIDQIYQAVHNNNLTKIHSDGTIKRREDGKVLKPLSYKPVDLFPILLAHHAQRSKELKVQGAENWPNDIGD
jgi:Phosphoribosyl-ATP pyrophosphohydrolase